MRGKDDCLRKVANRGETGTRSAMFAKLNLMAIEPKSLRVEFDRYYDPRKGFLESIKRRIAFHIHPRLRGKPPLK